MALRKGNAVQSQPEAAKDSMNGVDMSQTDDTPAAPQPEAEAAAARGVTQVESRIAEPPPRPDLDTAPPPPNTEVVDNTPAVRSSQPTGIQERAAPATGMTAAQPAGGNIKKELEEAGFGGLNLGFGAFPMVTLQNDGLFVTSEGKDLGKGFHCNILGSQAKYIYKNGVEGKEEEIIYSYDEINTADGTQRVQDVIDAWAAKGWRVEKRPYTEARARYIAEDESDPDDGMYVLLSIPKTSVPRYSGYVAVVMGSGRLPSDVITHVTVADKVTKVQFPFYPWGFREYKGQ